MSKVRMMLAVAAVAAVGVAAGCGGGDDASAGGGTTTAAESGPKVTFVSPVSGSQEDGVVNAEVQLEGFTINGDAVGMAPMDGEGHLHFSMDGGKYDTPKYSGANGELAVKLGTDGKYSPSVMPEITYSNLPPGEHTLRVALADNSHNETGDVAETTFTVE